MWDFNREDDDTGHARKWPGSAEDLVKILSGLYKGEKEDFLQTSPLNGFSMNNPRSWVSERLFIRPVLSKLNALLYDFDAGTASGCGGHKQSGSTTRGPGKIP